MRKNEKNPHYVRFKLDCDKMKECMHYIEWNRLWYNGFTSDQSISLDK